MSAMREPSGMVYQDSWFGSVLSVPFSLASGGVMPLTALSRALLSSRTQAAALAGWPGSNGSTMLTNDAAAAEAVPPAAAPAEAAVLGELDDPEDPQPASGTATTTSAIAGTSSAPRRACLIASIRPMDAPPFPPPALFAVIVAGPEPPRAGFAVADHDHGQFRPYSDRKCP